MTALTWITAGVLFVTSAGMLISQDWRFSLGLLGVQYLGAFWLTSQHWPMSMAAIKLVTGWMVITTLGMTLLNLGESDEAAEHFWPQGSLFRLFAAGLVIIIVIAVAPGLEGIIPGIGLPVISGSLILIGLGMLHLSITTQPFRVIVGLLTVLSGFETMYAALESAVLVAAMLSVVNLGLALAGAYLMTAGREEKAS